MKLRLSSPILLLCILYICITTQYVYAKDTDNFVDSLKEFSTIEEQFVDTSSTRKKRTPQVDIALFPPDTFTGLSLKNIVTPLPQFEDYLVRELTIAQYSQFHAAIKNGEKAIQSNNLAKAVELYTDAIAIAPFYYVGYMERGKVLAKFDKYTLAIQDFTTAIRLDSSIPDPYIFRAITRTKERQYGFALQDYQSALHIMGNNPVLLDKKGELLLILQDYKGATNSYSLAIEQKPYWAKLYYQRAIAYAGAENYTAMLTDYTKAIETNTYEKRLLHMRENIVNKLEKMYYSRESQPIPFINTTQDELLSIASLKAYNLLVDVKTLTPSSYEYPIRSLLKSIEKSIPAHILQNIQSATSKDDYNFALQALQDYSASIEKRRDKNTFKLTMLLLGYINQALGKYNDALLAYENFLDNSFDEPEIYMNYALVFIQKDGTKGVHSIIKKLFSKYKESYMEDRILSYIALLEKDYTQAIAYMKTVVAKKSYPLYTIQLAALYSVKQEYDTANSYCVTVIQKQYSNEFTAQAYFLQGIIAYLQNNMKVASGYFEKAQNIFPSWTNNIYYISSLFKEGKIKEATQKITLLLANTTYSPSKKIALYSLKGTLEYDSGEYTQSILSFSLGLGIKAPKYEKLYYNIALAELRKQNFSQASKNINIYIKAYPKDALGYVLRGDIELAKKQVRTALSSYKKALLLEENLTYAYSHIANAIYMMGILDTAEKYYTDLLSKNIDSPENYLLLAVIQAQSGKLEEAIEYCSSVIKKEPKNEQAFILRGMNYLRLGNLEDAYNDFSTAITLDATSSIAYTLRGEALERQGEYRKALVDFSSAIQINAFATEAYTLRGLVQFTLGDMKSGMQDLQISKKFFTMRKDKESSDIIQNIMNTLDSTR